MCQTKSEGGLRCSTHARQRLAKAIASKDRNRIAVARSEWQTTPAGIKELRAEGKDFEADLRQAERNAIKASVKNNFVRTKAPVFNSAGYDREGYDSRGFDKNDWNRKGFDKFGWDNEGFNKDDRDKNGYDREGFNSEGFYEWQRFDKGGYPIE